MAKYIHILDRFLRGQGIFLLMLVTLVLLVSTCSSTRRIEDNKFLLEKNRISTDNNELEKKQFRRYLRQSPNKEILGFKFHLFVYNLANPEKDKPLHNWLRRIGESPVIYDEGLKNQTKEQFEIYLENKGYYYSHIHDTVKFKKQKALVNFDIETGKPYIIKTINYVFEDTTIQSLILGDTINSLLKPGYNFDKEVIEEERNRIENYMRENGYYKFRNDYGYIQFTATRINNTMQLDLVVKILQSKTGYIDPISKVRRHQKYIIDNVVVISNAEKIRKDSSLSDTIWMDKIALIYPGKTFIKPQTIVSAIKCKPYSFYSIENVNSTTNKLTSLELFKIVNITFTEKPSKVTKEFDYGILDCKIEMIPRKKHSRRILTDLTVASKDLGLSASYTYKNYNLFRGVEKLSVQISGAIETLERYQEEGEHLDPMKELGISSSIDFPKFLLPIRFMQFTEKYDPSSSIQLSYNYQDRSRYLRTIFNSSYGYYWKANNFTQHWLYPLDFNYVKMDRIDSTFWSKIEDSPTKNKYTSHTILGLRYGFEWSTQLLEKLKNYYYFRLNAETAGLALNTLKQTGTWAGTDSTLFGVQYYQYIKSDFDFRKYFKLIEGNWLVYRLYLGVGYPYGKSNSLPLEKMYYSGGPYSVRAWETLTLGPGSDTTNYEIYDNKLGDLRLEANLEYRFDMFWKIEGALFLDIGNIWLIKDNPDRPNAVFKFDRFYKEFAVGTGLGTRLDLGFFLIRFDFGLKLRDPSIQESNKWVLLNGKVEDPIVFQFGIGYPF